MTPQQAKELLPIITAFAEGKTIQVNTAHGWRDEKIFSFDAYPSVYRIKPEPQEFWIRKCRILAYEHNFIGLTSDYSEPTPQCDECKIMRVKEQILD